MSALKDIASMILPEHRKIRVSKVKYLGDNPEEVFADLKTPFKHLVIRKVLEKGAWFNYEFRSDYSSFIGSFGLGKEPVDGEEMDLRYVSTIEKILGLYNIEDERGFCFVISNRKNGSEIK